MSYDFYKSREYKQKQSELVKAAWKRGVFDWYRKKEGRVCKRADCGKSFMVKPSDRKVFCSLSCAAVVNNTGRIRRKITYCINCGKETPRCTYKYCSTNCQLDYQYHIYIKRWKARELDGLNTIGMVTRHIKRYLREKYNNKCTLCSWSKINTKAGVVPLVADHIDGNWHNNKEENLRLLCPNCDSLTPTYKGLNRGNGRKNRAPSRRAKISKALRIL